MGVVFDEPGQRPQGSGGAGIAARGVDTASADDRPGVLLDASTPGASGRAPQADRSFLSGDAGIDDKGRVFARGAVAQAKSADEQDELLSGSATVDADGNFSAKGVIARRQAGGVTDTVGEVNVSNDKASVVGVKKEIDFGQATGLLPGNIVAKGDVAAGTANADASVTSDGISVGLGANAGEGSLTFGTSGSDSDLDTTTRVGLSEGVGLAGRIHFGDADKDGTPEIGVGADIGPVSFDVKSEDPARLGLGLMGAATGGVGVLATALGPAGPTNDTNVTKSITGAAVEAFGALSGALEGGVDVRESAGGGSAPPGDDED
jgi:hypothetical protein